MRYISYLFIILAGLWGGIFPARADDALESEKIYFFTYDGCPYCRQADEYITKNHPALAMEKLTYTNRAACTYLRNALKSLNSAETSEHRCFVWEMTILWAGRMKIKNGLTN